MPHNRHLRNTNQLLDKGNFTIRTCTAFLTTTLTDTEAFSSNLFTKKHDAAKNVLFIARIRECSFSLFDAIFGCRENHVVVAAVDVDWILRLCQPASIRLRSRLVSLLLLTVVLGRKLNDSQKLTWPFCHSGRVWRGFTPASGQPCFWFWVKSGGLLPGFLIWWFLRIRLAQAPVADCGAEKLILYFIVYSDPTPEKYSYPVQRVSIRNASCRNFLILLLHCPHHPQNHSLVLLCAFGSVEFPGEVTLPPISVHETLPTGEHFGVQFVGRNDVA